MGKISNEQKAKEIAKSNGINYKNHSKYEDDMDSTLECYKSALEAMQWKENQIIEWLWNNFNIHIHDSSVIQGAFNKRFESFDDFIEFMKKDLEKGDFVNRKRLNYEHFII